MAVIIVVFLFIRIHQSSNQDNRRLPLRSKLRHMDVLGTIIFLGAVCCLLLALQWGGQVYPWNNSRCIGLFVGFGLLTICFCYLQWRRGELAIIPLRILKKRSICMGALVLFFLGTSSLTVSAGPARAFVNRALTNPMVQYAYYLPIYFQSAQGVSTMQSGVRFIALVLPQIVGLVIVGAVVTQWGYYVGVPFTRQPGSVWLIVQVPYMIAGVVVTSVGAGLLTTIDTTTPTVKWAAYMVINGLGIGMAQQLPYTALQAVLEYISPAFSCVCPC